MQAWSIKSSVRVKGFLLVLGIVSRNYKSRHYFYFNACIDIPLDLH